MTDWLKTVLSRILAGELLPAEYYRQLDCDAALDARDSDAEFEEEWLRLNGEIERRWADVGGSVGDRALAEDIRRESFLAVSRATEQHEIAGYVSADWALIVRGRLVGVESDFLAQLVAAYQRGTFPCPPLE